jgi:hypothetical protein
METLEAVLPLIAFGMNAAAQVAVARYLPSLGLLRSIYAGFAAGFLCVCAVHAVTSLASPAGLAEACGSMLVSCITYAALGYCYFHFLNMGETARRVRILWEILECPEGLRLDEILARYPADEVLRLRIERLRNNGQIIDGGDRYLMGTRTVLFMARMIDLARGVLLGRGLAVPADETSPDTGSRAPRA